ncbi:hypothetical protein cypCar_00047766 [Cyprinus carpio]|nr:hypothetical protein cypCar_00047766 [Cyprinus carpio]
MQESVTKESQRETSEINGRLVTVIDTPGLFNTELTNKEIQREISSCISMILPGPHVFIIVLNLGQRFTQEESESVKIIQEMFGENSLMFTMVLFTRGDDLKNRTIEQCLGKPGSVIRNLTEACGNRFHVFNNNQTEDRTQVTDLLQKIDNMLKTNGGGFYSCKMFREMEREKQEQQMKILTERLEQMNREREELMKKLEEEKDRIEMLMEEERQNEDKERKRGEEFKQETTKNEQKIPQVHLREENEAEKEVTVYRKLESEYSKWSWSLYSAMMETENKLYNKIENYEINEVDETDLTKELKKTSEVEKSISEFFDKDKDANILIQWKTSFETKIKKTEENIVKETKRKLTEILQQRDLKKMIANTLYKKSKELALKLKDKANDEKTLREEFDLSWKEWFSEIPRDTAIKDIDILKDVKRLLSDIYESAAVCQLRVSRDIFTVSNYSDYVMLKKTSVFTGPVTDSSRSAIEELGCALLKEDGVQIKTFVKDISQQTNIMIQSFNISKMGYNISCIQQLTDYIKRRISKYEEGQVKYVFKNEFFVDLVLSICKRANKMITDQHRLFREANDPEIYVEKKREEYYSIFHIYCHCAASAAVFGEQLLFAPLLS